MTDRENYKNPKRPSKKSGKVTPKGQAQSKRFLEHQYAKREALLRDWKQGRHEWLLDKKTHNIVRVLLENYSSIKH